MNTIEVNFENVIEIEIKDSINVFCKSVLKNLEITNWEISILICDNTYIKDLNNRYRYKNEPTDVLSFNQDLVPIDGTIYAGDIVISLETVKLHSKTFSVPLYEELKRVLVHGILHLKGMDHQTNSKEEKMLQIQEDILKTIPGDIIN